MLLRAIVMLSVHFLLCHSALAADDISPPGARGNWHQAAGPNGSWRVDGKPPVRWSVTRNENIAWRTPLPECGQSSVTVWGDKVFVTMHEPLQSLDDRFKASDIVGCCLDSGSGELLWTITLPGTQAMEPAGGFSDATVFAPITDGQHVWFFNRCGSMGCYDLKGKEVWRRIYKMRFKHSNRQCEPILVRGVILNVEVLDKEAGSKLKKFAAGSSNTVAVKLPKNVDPKSLWTYIHGIDAATGKILWRETVGTSIHDTPVIGFTADGKPAIVHARGGGHSPLEKPYGISLTRLAAGHEGETIWSTPLSQFSPVFSNHWDAESVYAFAGGQHIVLSTQTGKVIRRQQLYRSADLWRFDQSRNDWVYETDAAVKVGKTSHPNTNHANIVAGDWHYFLSHDVHFIGRVHVKTGKVEYLEVPAQLVADREDRAKDRRLWGKGLKQNRPTNASGLALGRKGHTGTGWGHISAASPTLIGRYLFFPVVTGTVYVIDTTVDRLSPKALVAVNDLGLGGETWTLSSLTFSQGRLFAHTMREVICIGRLPKQ
jgi:outer membrane protein assembly factor BamB